MCVIDPMHNLLLGTAKHMLEVWNGKGLIGKPQQELIKERVGNFVTHGTSGRQPTSNKILSGFTGFTAEQWKSWTLYYSLFSLKDILPHQDYKCWLLFVKACSLICRRTIAHSEMEEADRLLLQFCVQFVQLYGKELCTPNMHLHCHLVECIADYGPVYSFWLFAYERLNGIMGAFHTNCRDISVQLMRRFLDSVHYAPINWPSEYATNFLPMLEHCRYKKGSLKESSLTDEVTEAAVHLLPPVREQALSTAYLQCAQAAFDILYGQGTHTALILYACADGLEVNGDVLGSSRPRYLSASIVFVQKDSHLCVAQIEFYAKCSAICKADKKTQTEWLAAVKWFESHQCQLWYGRPTEVWCTTTKEFEFIPVSNIRCRVVYTRASVDFGRIIGSDTVLVVSPIEI